MSNTRYKYKGMGIITSTGKEGVWAIFDRKKEIAVAFEERHAKLIAVHLNMRPKKKRNDYRKRGIKKS
jgi:hypothetical protein